MKGKSTYLECEKRWVFRMLIFVAGFYGGYTLMVRGGVFSNAQTGNIALCALALGNGDWQKAVSLRDLYAPKADLFPQYYVKKSQQASALPWLFILSCRKISRFGVLCSFEGKIFSRKNIQRTKKYWMYFEDDGFLVGKKILSKPYKSLSEPA